MIFYFVSYKLAFASLFCGRCALMYLLVLFSGKMRPVKAPLRKKKKRGVETWLAKIQQAYFKWLSPNSIILVA